MPVGDRKDPYRGYNFRVEVDGITRGGFRECSGLDTSQDPIDYREGTDSLTTRRLPGLVKYSNIILKWGITDDAELWGWRQSAMDGKVERTNGSIVLLDDTGRKDEALRTYENALCADPALADCHYNLALLCEELSRPRDAIRHMAEYRRLVRAKGGSPSRR